jgi:DnaJ homolog subfamily C member 2
MTTTYKHKLFEKQPAKK